MCALYFTSHRFQVPKLGEGAKRRSRTFEEAGTRIFYLVNANSIEVELFVSVTSPNITQAYNPPSTLLPFLWFGLWQIDIQAWSSLI
jgi:hypothetical protein